MKMLEKLKNRFLNQSNNGPSFSMGKLIGFILIVIGNVAAISVGTIAWFNINSRNSEINMVSGDLNVEALKVTAYKYIYPYYQNSTEFIDYDAEGTVKKYVLEDHTLIYDDTPVDNISITSDDATITLGSKVSGTYTTDASEASYDNVYLPQTVSPSTYVPEFRYYLIGDDTFSGVSSGWYLEDGFAFSSREAIIDDKTTVLDNVVVSQGAEFILFEFDKNSNSSFVYNYFPLLSIAESSSPFRISDDGTRLLCLRSGIYKFTYSENQLKIELHTKDAGVIKDISVISNNLLDPTKISIDYAGSIDKVDYSTIEDYIPTAINEQNTTMIIDIELKFKNASEVTASLEVERTDTSDNSIFNTPGKYTDTVKNLTGYIDDAHANPLRASDFFNYYAIFTETAYASTNDIWNALHDDYHLDADKFINGESYDKKIDCTLHPKAGGNDETTIPACDPEVGQIYHCYIAIEYDNVYIDYFLNKNRLGKTYLLDRDFSFHFYGVQQKEEES